ncbi:hypothetical protein HDR58_04345 [bacterium]|nr:hypothetical protein [bacterium]
MNTNEKQKESIEIKGEIFNQQETAPCTPSDDTQQTSYELLSAIHDDLSSIRQNVSFLSTIVMIGFGLSIFAVFIVIASFILK